LLRPDFAQIDQIKDEICEALTSYSTKIERFFKEMSESDSLCDDLRDEIGRLRTHRMQLSANARCAITLRPVLSSGEPFYVFPSGYVYLASALKEEVVPYLNDKQRDRVKEIESEMKQLNPADPTNYRLQAELDGLIAAECPLTGSVMVESIDREFDGSLEVGDVGYRSAVERADV
jgi:vacuolar protein sorting-associated protein 18